jgi:manganese-dependent inorganic pyrophosphatase
MLTFGKGCEDICERAFGEAFVDHYAYLKGIVSRKKQIVPAIIKALQE